MSERQTWIAALRDPKVRLFWFGQAFSLTGDRVYQVALSWIAATMSQSGLQVSLVLAAAALPQAIVALFGGALSDRAGGRSVMIVADSARALIVGALGIVLVLGRAEMWMLYVTMLLFGFLQALFQPASMALIADISPSRLLPATNSLLAATRQVGMVVGPAVAAGLVMIGGASSPVLFDAGTFLISVLTLSLLRISITRRPSSTPLWSQIKPGCRELARHPFLLGASAFSALGNVLCAGPWLVALPLLAISRAGIGLGGMGLAYSFQAVGALAGAFLMGAGIRISRPGLLVYLGASLQGLALVVIGLYPYLPVLVGSALVIGMSSSLFGVVWQTSLQTGVAREFVGRVSGAGMAISMLVLAPGFVVVGKLVEMWGPETVFWAGGAVMTVLSLVMTLRPEVREMTLARRA